MQHLFEAREYWTQRLRALAEAARRPLSGPLVSAPEQARLALDREDALRLHRLSNGNPLLNCVAVIAATQRVVAPREGSTTAVLATAPRKTDGGAHGILPIVQELSPGLRFRDLLAATRRTLLDSFAVQSFPVGGLLEELQLDRAAIGFGVRLAGFSGEIEPRPAFCVTFDVQPEHIHLQVEGLSSREELHALASQIGRALSCGLQDPQCLVEEMDLRSVSEQSGVHGWSQAARTLDVPASVIAQFEAQVVRNSDAPALVGAATFTYAQLNTRVNRVARRLRECGVARERKVALYFDAPYDMIVGLLAVLKAGGAYVPIDPLYPAARQQHMLNDSAPHVVLTTEARRFDLPGTDARVVAIDTLVASERDGENLGVPRDPGDLAYVIYTSGSTGVPRGVQVNDGALANTIAFFAQQSEVGPASRVSQISSFSFDGAALECFVALTRGAVLCLVPPAIRGAGSELTAFLRDHEVTLLGAITPSVLALLEPAQLPKVRALHVGGERCPAELADRWSEGRTCINCYGPTEATIDCMASVCRRGEGDPPIGRPIPNARAYVLDARRRPVPIGVVGELYVGGVPVARGYLNNPAATAAAFVPDSLSGQSGQRLYRTGDLARVRADGTFEFCGRADQQVKLDGYRIELEEIEAVLQAHAGVKQAAVALRQRGDHYQFLVAYVVREAAAPSWEELRAYVSQHLPGYMVPSACVMMERLPTTVNGKLDRRALPMPSEHGSGEHHAHDPNDRIVQAVAEIWREILDRDAGPEDNFFDLGGRSLHVTRVLSKVAKAFKVELPLELVFRFPKLGELAREIGNAVATEERSAGPRLAPVRPRPSQIPLSCAQQRLWFLTQVLPKESAALYNGALPVRLTGALDVAALARSFSLIVARHEVLRTTYRTVAEEPCQIIHEPLPFFLAEVDLSALSKAERHAKTVDLAAQDASEPFDLSKAPLLRATLVRWSEREHVLLLNIHHIAFDGWSSSVLLNELGLAYQAFVEDAAPRLPDLPIQYADFAIWQRAFMSSERLQQQIAYWRERLHGLSELTLSAARPRPSVPTYAGVIRSFELDRELRERIEALSKELGITLFMTLLAGYYALLHRYTGQDDIAVGSPVASRRSTELEPLIGFFVNSLVLRTDLSGNPTFKTLLSRVRETTLQAYDHQDVPFEKLVEVLRPERSATHNPLFRAAFSLQNTPLRVASPRDLEVSPWETHNKTTKFDLVVALTDHGDRLVGDIEYSSELFDDAFGLELARLYERTLRELVAHPDKRILDVPFDEAAETVASHAEPGGFEFGS